MSNECGIGVWVAHYGDWSSIAIFATEIEALRYAVARDGMTAEFMEWGEIR